MRRLPGLILLAGVAFIVLHIRPSYLGMLAALALSMPYTGRRKTFTVDERALVADVLMIEYVCVAAWLAVIVGEVPFLLASVAVQASSRSSPAL